MAEPGAPIPRSAPPRHPQRRPGPLPSPPLAFPPRVSEPPSASSLPPPLQTSSRLSRSRCCASNDPFQDLRRECGEPLRGFGRRSASRILIHQLSIEQTSLPSLLEADAALGEPEHRVAQLVARRIGRKQLLERARRSVEFRFSHQ